MSDNIKLSSLQYSCLFTYILLSLFNEFGFYYLIRISEVDSYISIIISYFMGLFIILIFIIIFNYRSDLSIRDKINYLFGHIIGSIINCILCVMYLFIGIIVIYNMSNFIIINYLSVTPLLVILLVIGVLVIYNVYYGIYNISRVSTIFLFIILFLSVISIFSLVGNINIDNFKPFLHSSIINPVKGGFMLSLINVVPIFMLLVIEKNKIIKENYVNMNIVIFYSIGFILLLLSTFVTIGVLGINLTDFYLYPMYIVLRKINILNSIDRIENFIYFKWIISSFITISLVIYYVSYNINKNSKIIVPSINTLFIIICILFIRINSYFYYLIINLLPFICFVILFIFVIIFLNIIIRKKIEN